MPFTAFFPNSSCTFSFTRSSKSIHLNTIIIYKYIKQFIYYLQNKACLKFLKYFFLERKHFKIELFQISIFQSITYFSVEPLFFGQAPQLLHGGHSRENQEIAQKFENQEKAGK